jgi:hypothetical protein
MEFAKGYYHHVEKEKENAETDFGWQSTRSERAGFTTP